MIGAPFDKWEDVAGASYYTGLGSGEFIWLVIAIILCILALWWGHRHESEANVSGVAMGGAAAGAATAAATAAPVMARSTSSSAAAKLSSSAPAKKKSTAAKRSAAKPKATKKAPAKSAKPKSASGPVRLKKAKGKADDLKQISGVGPKLEKTLNKLGFWHFHQIASWKKADVAIVDDELSFKGRIERDDWIKQAKVLVKKK